MSTGYDYYEGDDDDDDDDDYFENTSTYTDDVDDADDDDDDCGYDDDDEGGMQNFAVLSMEELEKRKNDDVCIISTVLSVSREVAILVLIHFDWNVSGAEEEWFRDEERIRQSIGLLTNPTKLFDDDDIVVMCRICLEDFCVHQMTAATCGHLFCSTCWISYISISIHDGPGCLSLRCPDPKCCVAIGEEMVKLVVSKEDGSKYNKYLIRSYVENSKKLKWCPSPNCDYAIEYELGSVTGSSFDVKCACSYSFCWNCLEEIHRPVDCETVANWNGKNKSESENTNWILANSKQCPMCKKPIEKNLGCMHMTCSCRHEFCWLCLETWSEHEANYYKCNKYEKERREGKLDEQERIRSTAKNSLDKYVHFYQRFAANEVSRKLSIAHLEKLQSEQLEKICDVQQVCITDVDYIAKAWEQIIECRRLLKWAYAYGYYIADEERAKKEFFEFIQGEAEGALERLHKCAENEVLQYAVAKGPSPDFSNLKEKLCRLTGVTRGYFEHLVRALENGLVDVTSKGEDETGLADSIEVMPYQDWMCFRCTSYNSYNRPSCKICSHIRLD